MDIDGGQAVRVAIGFNDDAAVLAVEPDQTDNALRSFAAGVLSDSDTLSIGADSDHAERRLRNHYSQISAGGRKRLSRPACTLFPCVLMPVKGVGRMPTGRSPINPLAKEPPP